MRRSRTGQPSVLIERLELKALLAAAFPEFIDPNPSAGNQFGHSVVALSTGNVVITSPFDDAGGSNAGAVYLFNGATGALISTLRGSTAGSNVGSGGVIALSTGNFVIMSPSWSDGVSFDVGAVTFGSGTTGVAGIVSASNSLVGTGSGDAIGGGVGGGVQSLSNGNFVVSSPNWDNKGAKDVGAVTFGSGINGVSGVVSAANSLVGSATNDSVGSTGVTVLSNGNYVVRSPFWDDGVAQDVGAVTFGNGVTGVAGLITMTNSLVGSNVSDRVGSSIVPLSSGNYVVVSSGWGLARGAVTFASGTNGLAGVVSSTNSLVGGGLSNQVGGGGVTALTNGNYVVVSPNWDGAVANVGAVTFGNGTTGISGVVSASNSLVGSTGSDQVGGGGVTALGNGNYVITSPFWDGAVANVGAVTFGNGTTGISGVVSASNSLVGSTANNNVGSGGVTALTNGNYVVMSPNWDTAVANVGAVTFGNGTTGISGVVSASNSLVGSTLNDQVGGGGAGGVTALTNGNYVVVSPNWDSAAIEVGAVTFGNGTTGISGVVSASNSLVGSTANDQVGQGGVTALTNGNYVVRSGLWDGVAANVGAVTFGNGTTGISGVVSASNSLVGSTANDNVGAGGLTALTNGNYVVRSGLWDGVAANVGAVTFGNGTTGISGVVSASNSLVGTTASDQVGQGGVTALANGNYVVLSPNWDGAATNVGAATFGSGTIGISGVINTTNSAIGLTANTGLQVVVVDDTNSTFFGRFRDETGGFGGRVRVGSQVDGFAVNQPPSAVVMTPASASLAENTSTGAAIELSTIAITDDGIGTNTLSLSGPDAASFEIVGNKLRLRAGVTLDFETKTAYSVRVNVDDTTVGSTPDAFADFILTVTDVAENSAPTAVVLTPASASLAENTSTGAAIELSTVAITDDGIGTNTLSLSGPDAASFEIVGNKLRLRAGVTLDFETKTAYSVRVNVDDSTVGSTPDAFADFILTVTDVAENSAPTAVVLTPASASLAENTSTGAAIELSTVAITDDGIGTNTLSLSGPDAASFEIVGNKLRLRAGVTLDFETKTAYSVRVNVDDSTVGSTPDAFADFILTVTDVAENSAPTAVVLTPASANLAENTSTGASIELSTIAITDDSLGTNTLSLSGPDAASFEIVGNKLRLKAGVLLDFETKTSYSVRVNVDDTTVGSTPDVFADFTLTITNVNEAPTAVVLTPASASLAENTSTGASIDLSTIAITDDGIGTNTLSLSGPDAASFEIVGNKLRLKVGVTLDFETKASYSVRVNVDDTTVGSTPDAFADFTLTITNVNEAPTAVVLTPASASLAENTSTGAAIELTTITITDDGVGTNTLSLSGPDAASFEIVGNKLRLKANVILDFETKSSYSVRVNVDDTTVGSTPDAFAEFTLTITNVNDVALDDLVVQNGQQQRSFVRYVDMVFSNGGADLLDLISNNRISLRRFDPSGNGSGVSVPLPAASVSGRTLKFDFGAQGVGGNRNSNLADGRYQLAIDNDGDGSADAITSFHRLLGDVNGDQVVNALDKTRTMSLFGQPYSAEGDVNGDGIVNSADLSVLNRAIGRRVNSGL